MNKKCSICKIEKLLLEYYPHYKANDGLSAHCKKCHSVIAHRGYLKKRKETGIEKWNEIARIKKKNWRDNNLIKARKEERIYYANNIEKFSERRRKWGRIRRLKIIKHYGEKCECCGEKDYRFLTFDHINGDGKKHRKMDFMNYIIKNNYPKDLRLLCYNCNMSREFYGGKDKICPHKLRIVID